MKVTKGAAERHQQNKLLKKTWFSRYISEIYRQIFCGWSMLAVPGGQKLPMLSRKSIDCPGACSSPDPGLARIQ